MLNVEEWKQKMQTSFLQSHEIQLIDKLHELVRDGTLGLDYTISDRDKNRTLRNNYVVTDATIKKILLSLCIDDFVKFETSNNPKFSDEIVYIFKKYYLLMPRWEENSDYKNVRLYIKIVWPDDEKFMFIISFHEDED